MDTDGSLSNGGFDYISKSPQLADDVCFVARSVGLAAYVKPCAKLSQLGNGDVYHRVSISGDCAIIPTRVPNKICGERKQKKNHRRTSFKLSPEPDAEYFGFTLDGDGRYLMDDFTVTHNSGKGTLASFIVHSAVERGRRVIFLVNRRTLVHDMSKRLDRLGLEHGVIMGNDPRNKPWLNVHVASIDTLHRRHKMPEADLLILDEAHFSVSPTWAKVLDKFPESKVLGMTATPIRLDGRGLGELFETMVKGPTVSELIAAGHLVPSRTFAPSEPDVSTVKSTAGDFNQKALAEVCDKKKLVGNIVEHWKRLSSDRKTAAFGVNQDHAMHIAEEFRCAGIDFALRRCRQPTRRTWSASASGTTSITASAAASAALASSPTAGTIRSSPPSCWRVPRPLSPPPVCVCVCSRPRRLVGGRRWYTPAADRARLAAPSRQGRSSGTGSRRQYTPARLLRRPSRLDAGGPGANREG